MEQNLKLCYKPAANISAGDTPKESANPCKNRPTNNAITASVGSKNEAMLTRAHPNMLRVWKTNNDGLRPKMSEIGPPIKQPPI